MGSFEARAYLDVGNPAAQRVEVTTPSAMPGTAPHYAVHHQDGLGRVYRQVRRGPAPGQDIVEETSYDARGRVAAKTAAYYQGESPQTTTLAYDFKGRLVKATHADGTAVLKSYGLWSETTIDEHGHPTTVRYDAYGRAVRKEPVPANYTYDLLGHLIGMTDALGNAWSWTFDSLGRNLLQHDPDSGQWSFEYDDAGRPTAHTDAKGQRTEFTYDSGGRLAGRTNPDGTVTYTYSETRAGHFNVGRITTVRDPASVLKTDYDALGRAVGLERTLDGTSYIFQRRYDATGRPLGLTYPDGDVVGTPESPFRYDLAGRLLSVPGILSEVLYDAAGRPVRQANANGTVTTRTYSPERGFLTGVHTSGATTIQDLAYSPDSTGLVTQVTSPFAGESWVYAYDNVHRLVSAESLSSPSDSQTFQYDEIDRIVFNSRLGPYSYPSPGQPRPHAPLQVAGDPRSYDPNGNLIASGGRSLSWTADNRLRQADTTQFTYDATGERLRKTSADSISVYPLGDDYEVTDGVITKYVKVGALGVVGKRVGGTTYWLHTDRLRSIQAVTDASGAEIFRRTYRPYGDTLSQGGAHIESRGYTDQRRDDATGLVYLHARYYDPEAALFVSPDPLHPTSPGVGANRYAYSGGNPTNVTDPTGLTSCSVITISIGGEDYTFVDCAEEVTVVDTGAGAGGIDPIDFFRRYILPVLPLPIPAPDPVTPDPPPTPQPSPSSPPPTTPPQTPNQPPGQPPGQTPTTPPKGEGKKPPSIPVIPVIPKPDEPFWTAWDHWKWFRKVTTPIRLVKAIDCSAEHTTCVEQSDRRCEAAYPDGTRDQVGMFAFTQSTCKLQGVNDCLGRYASCQSPFW
jgi:RHS repeat-associated protein